MSAPENMKFKVWWIPQVPMASFEVEVDTLDIGRKICSVLADYDLFQFENNVKPDYCNVGGVMFSHPDFENGEWFDVPDDEDEWADNIEAIAAARTLSEGE